MERSTQQHNIAPVFDAASRVLILGSFPSVKSREAAFFYAHPQNRFWRVLSAVVGEEIPESIEDKRAMLLRHGIALWDVIAECEIEGSSDASISAVVPNDLSRILNAAPIRHIFCNGGTALRYYRRFGEPRFGAAEALPSTSGANARSSLATLTEVWRGALVPWL